MAELICPTCSTSYDTSGFEPGERFRCRGDGCNEKLTVPDGISGDVTPTPAPAAQQAGAKRRKKKSGVVKAAMPAAAAPVDDDEVLEPKDPAPRRRGGTGRRGRPGSSRGRAAEPVPTGPVDRHGRPLPQAASPAPLYAAIGGVLVILLIVVFAMMGSTPGGPQNKRKKKKSAKWEKATNIERKTAEQLEAEDAARKKAEAAAAKKTAEAQAASGKKSGQRMKKDYRFIEVAGVKSRIEPHYDKLVDEDPNATDAGGDAIFDVGDDAIPVLLNKLADLKMIKRSHRNLAAQILKLLEDFAPEGFKDDLDADALVVDVMNSGKWGFEGAIKTWREYFRDKRGLKAKDVTVPR